jgi:hypothetical protein
VTFACVCRRVPHREAADAPFEEVTMGIGLGIVLIVLGAALAWAIEVDVQFIDDNALGWILMVAGLAAIALSLVINAQRSRTTTRIEEQRPSDRYVDRG